MAEGIKMTPAQIIVASVIGAIMGLFAIGGAVLINERREARQRRQREMYVEGLR